MVVTAGLVKAMDGLVGIVTLSLIATASIVGGGGVRVGTKPVADPIDGFAEDILAAPAATANPAVVVRFVRMCRSVLLPLLLSPRVIFNAVLHAQKFD